MATTSNEGTMKTSLFSTITLLFFISLTVSAESSLFSSLKEAMTGTAPQRVTILAKMLPAQRIYVVNEIVPKFEKKYNCTVQLYTYKNSSEIPKLLELDGMKSKPEISLVLSPFELNRELVTKDLILPLKEVPGIEDIEAHMSVYHPIFKAMALEKKEYYFIPRMIHTQTLFYRKSKVAHALKKYEHYRDELQQKLQTLNGYGLPVGYSLEDDPNQWDFYDLFTVGYIWSQEEYNGAKYGRIAHRSDLYFGTAGHLMDRAYQLNASSDNVLAIRGTEVAEMFLWERVFAQTGIFDKRSYQEKWRGAQLYKGIKMDRCFLTWLSPVELGRIHGWENDPTMKSYLEDPDDMGIAVVPQGVSFSLETNGEIKKVGSRNSTLNGNFWAIPKRAPEAELAFKFATYISNRNWNARESSNFLMIPVRKDLLENIAATYQMGWVGDIYKTSVKQIAGQVKDSITIVPRTPKFSQIAQLYAETYHHMFENKSTTPFDVAEIERYLKEEVTPKVRDILGKSYPEE